MLQCASLGSGYPGNEIGQAIRMATPLGKMRGGGVEGGYRIMKWLKGPSRIWFFRIQTQEEHHSLHLAIVLIEPHHLRRDMSRPGDIMALERDVHRLNTAMDLDIASGLTKSCLSSSCNSSDFVRKAAEKAKFRKDKNSANPISSLLQQCVLCL